jgi:hypothetical protein
MQQLDGAFIGFFYGERHPGFGRMAAIAHAEPDEASDTSPA